jgi:pyridoxal phosphate enzyme (YggS family)
MAIRENIARVREQIAQACVRVNRDPEEIMLVGVSKTMPAEKIEEALTNGITAIGENRVQEAKTKFEIIGTRATWHMVGHLQTNKVKDALKIFSLIHSLDSIRLAQEIEKRATEPIACLIEVNTSKEATKYGIAPSQTEEFFQSLRQFTHIDIKGLMTIGPGWAVEDAEASRACFRLLKELRDTLQRKYKTPLPILSMGMTSDYVVAIEEGSTMVRIGTAIFGPRTCTRVHN